MWKLVEGPVAAGASAIAVLFSGFTLWDTSLQQSDLRIYVPPVIFYAGHQQNSNVEAIKIPVTIVNEGAQTGTVLSLNLDVADGAGHSKGFYSASIVPEEGSPIPFAPMVLQGHTSKTAILLFYTRGSAQKVEQIIAGPGQYRFSLALDEAKNTSLGLMSFFHGNGSGVLSFDRELPAFDARMDAMPLYAKDWQSAISAGSK